MHGAEARVELVGHRDVREHVPGRAALLLGDLRHLTPAVLLVLGCHDVVDDHVAPVREALQRVVVALRELVEAGAFRRVAEVRELLVEREEHHASQPGMASSTKPERNERRTGKLIGIVSATTLPPFARARSAAASFAVALVEVARADAHDVPVERPLRGDRHVGHELDGPVVELRADLRDELERRALELARDLRHSSTISSWVA